MSLLNILLLVQEFYAIEAMAAMLSVNRDNHFEPMKHSHDRWQRDFYDFRDEYINKFASAIYDYTVLVVAAELRHGREKASQYLDNYYSASMSRDEVYKECFIYSDHDILTAGLKMFDTDRVKWSKSYGGDKWKQIAKAGLMKGKVNDCVFIDHCVDLSHNCSIYFDKQAGIFVLHDIGRYQSFLDLKRYCEPEALINTRQGFRLNQLLRRANNLNIISECASDDSLLRERNEAESLLFTYCPSKWGAVPVDYSDSNIQTQQYYDGADRDGDRDYNEDRREYARCA